MLEELLLVMLGLQPVRLGLIDFPSALGKDATMSKGGQVLWARVRLDISKLIVQVIVEFFVLVFLVQDLLLLDLRGG